MSGLINFFTDKTPIGRFLTKNESFGEAWVNANKEQAQDVKDFFTDKTPIGRYITKDESFTEAWVNANKEQVKMIFA